jgi:hypothetical protein
MMVVRLGKLAKSWLLDPSVWKKRTSLVPAPMRRGWAETKAAASSAPVEEEEDEMAGPARAMEEEEEEPDEPEEEEDDFDNYHHLEASAGIDEEEGVL